MDLEDRDVKTHITSWTSANHMNEDFCFPPLKLFPYTYIRFLEDVDLFIIGQTPECHHVTIIFQLSFAGHYVQQSY